MVLALDQKKWPEHFFYKEHITFNDKDNFIHSKDIKDQIAWSSP